MWFVFRAAGLAILFLTAGCTSVIHNSRDISKPGIDFVDARQRAVVSGKKITTITTIDKNKKTIEENLVLCSEPSPDVFSVLASSFGLDVGLAPSAASDTVKIASALSENAATIQRTQTINLLRESFFRTCERYMNGAITPAEMIVQSARDQRAMVSVLAIEQLTGSLTPPAVVIESSAIANANESAAQVIKDLNAAKSAADIAATKAEADDKSAKALSETNKCPDIAKVDAAARTEDQKKKSGECDAATAIAKKSRDAADAATAHYEALRTYVSKATPTGVAAQGGGELLGSAPAPATAADRAAVASAVQMIVQQTFGFDEYTMLCMRTLSEPRGTGNENVYDACVENLVKGLEAENYLRNEKVGLLLDQRIGATDASFSKVEDWLMSVNGNATFSDRLTALKTALSADEIDGENTGDFFNSTDIKTARAHFAELGDDIQTALIRAADQLNAKQLAGGGKP